MTCSAATRHPGEYRGQPIDCYSVEVFQRAPSADAHGCVHKVGGDVYMRRYCGDRVTQGEIPLVKAEAPQIPDDTFDYWILTQVLRLV